jgi:hypothetical protein
MVGHEEIEDEETIRCSEAICAFFKVPLLQSDDRLPGRLAV